MLDKALARGKTAPRLTCFVFVNFVAGNNNKQLVDAQGICTASEEMQSQNSGF